MKPLIIIRHLCTSCQTRDAKKQMKAGIGGKIVPIDTWYCDECLQDWKENATFSATLEDN